jgi:hypothetical protein
MWSSRRGIFRGPWEALAVPGAPPHRLSEWEWWYRDEPVAYQTDRDAYHCLHFRLVGLNPPTAQMPAPRFRL